VRSASLEALPSACDAVVALLVMVAESCSMRFSSTSVTARVRCSIWPEIDSVRPSHRFLEVGEDLVQRGLGLAGGRR